jgi:hypothetical protein
VPLSAIPLGVNPDGSPPNFIDPPSLATAVEGVGVTFAVFATICVALKLYSSFTHTKKRKYRDRLDDCKFAQKTLGAKLCADVSHRFRHTGTFQCLCIYWGRDQL